MLLGIVALYKTTGSFCSADIPDNNSLHVSLKKLDPPADKLVIHPFGILTFSERLVPLELPRRTVPVVPTGARGLAATRLHPEPGCRPG